MMMMILALGGCREVQQAATKVQKLAMRAKEEATTPALACDAAVPNEEPQGCLSGTLKCGDVIEGTIEGGESNWSDDFYAGIFCFPAGDNRAGPERVYRLEAPANQDIHLKLQSDCVDLDIAALAWQYEGTCPGVNHLIPECEADAHVGGGDVHLSTFKARDYLVAVEGKNRKTGPFRLTVTCGPLAGR